MKIESLRKLTAIGNTAAFQKMEAEAAQKNAAERRVKIAQIERMRKDHQKLFGEAVADRNLAEKNCASAELVLKEVRAILETANQRVAGMSVGHDVAIGRLQAELECDADPRIMALRGWCCGVADEVRARMHPNGGNGAEIQAAVDVILGIVGRLDVMVLEAECDATEFEALLRKVESAAASVGARPRLAFSLPKELAA